MATIELSTVLLGHVTLPERIEARFRTYAGTKAIEEFTRFFSDKELTAVAQAAGRKIWTEEDILVASKLPGALWGGSETGATLRQDIYSDMEHRKMLEDHINDLTLRLASLTPAE